MARILLVNPPVYDFAAYDLWAKPLALLYMSSVLKKQGHFIDFFDYMDRHSFLLGNNITESTKYGCGHYIKEEIKKPNVIKNIRRRYYRFGIPGNIAEEYLKSIKKPDVIFMTSLMTYWYPGVKEAAELLKKIFPDVPLILGGIYATLCSEHAKENIKPTDLSIGSFKNLIPVLKKYGINICVSEFNNSPEPDYSFYYDQEYVVLKTSIGCPHRCDYCAQYILNDSSYTFKSPDKIKNEIFLLSDFAKTNNIVFYDDALLYKSDINITVLLKKIQKDNKKFYFHTPNGLHARFLNRELADLMFSAKFINPRFSLETTDINEQKFSDNKVNNNQYKQCIKYLNAAGYRQKEYTTYLLAGLPDQNLDFLKDSIKFVHDLGSKVSLSEYSPIPYTKAYSSTDNIFFKEPLLQNNTFYISQLKEYDKITELKKFAKELNNKL